MKIRNILHTIVAIALGLFFIYAGSKKFIPKNKVPQTEQQQLKAQADLETQAESIKSNHFEKPILFNLVIKGMSKGGFLKIVGILQILGGILLLYNRSRLIGGLIILPIITNIFLLHLVLDNRTDEILSSGFYLLVTISVIAHYHIRLKELWLENIKSGIVS